MKEKKRNTLTDDERSCELIDLCIAYLGYFYFFITFANGFLYSPGIPPT